MTILDKLADYAGERVAADKRQLSLVRLRQQVEQLPVGELVFQQALAGPNLAFICECKKASPSKGLIAPDFPYMQIAQEYQAAGADAISVLTEPKWFLGSDQYLEEISGKVTIPCLRKDFTIDEYQIYQAKLLGASAVLLICSLLSTKQLTEYLDLCAKLGLSALVEAHDEAEVESALQAGSQIIGVNNRNLKDFTVNPENSSQLRKLIPAEVLFVSESGVNSAEDVRKIQSFRADAVLVGETLMRATNKKAKLAQLKSKLDGAVPNVHGNGTTCGTGSAGFDAAGTAQSTGDTRPTGDR